MGASSKLPSRDFSQTTILRSTLLSWNSYHSLSTTSENKSGLPSITVVASDSTDLWQRNNLIQIQWKQISCWEDNSLVKGINWYQNCETREVEGRTWNGKEIRGRLEIVCLEKGIQFKRRKWGGREVVGLTGKSDLWMKKVSGQSDRVELMRGSRWAGGANWLWHEARNEKVKEWEQGGNWKRSTLKVLIFETDWKWLKWEIKQNQAPLG